MGCRPIRIYTTMNILDEQTVEKHGQHYRYDADYDCFYRVCTAEEYADLSHWSKYNWLYVTGLLCAICWFVSN
jgi:hypothetical protein